MKAVNTVRDSITEDNSTLTFFLELEKSITKEALEQKQMLQKKKKKQCRKNLQKEHSKYPMQEKNEEERIPLEKETIS